MSKNIKEEATVPSESIVARMPQDVVKAIRLYMTNFNRANKMRPSVTDTFIKEVYFATTKENFTTRVSVQGMIDLLNEGSWLKLRARSYEITGFQQMDANTVSIEVNRNFSNGSSNKVKYLLLATRGEWKVHHIIRRFEGKLLRKLASAERIYYELGDEHDRSVIFAVEGYKDDYRENDELVIEGYLEVEEMCYGSPFYQVFTMSCLDHAK